MPGKNESKKSESDKTKKERVVFREMIGSTDLFNRETKYETTLSSSDIIKSSKRRRIGLDRMISFTDLDKESKSKKTEKRKSK